MGRHSNKKIEKHVESSEQLVEKMQKLAEDLHNALEKNFEENMGVPLPNIIQTKVREVDIAMVYSTDPRVDEYINGARKVLNTAFAGETVGIINGILDVVEVVVTKIIGAGDVMTGIHSTSVATHDYITAVFSAVQKATAKDWATTTDFFVSYYAFLVFRPSMTQKSMLMRGPMLGAAAAKPAVDIKSVAAKNYAYSPI